MNILLDTHVALWAITDSPALVPAARDMILDPDNVIWVSAASIWEIAIKHRLGRGDMPVSGRDALGYFRQAGYRLLAVAANHAVAVEDLPDHHRDPFDRLLVAQAIVEPLRLMTRDADIARYGDMIISV